MISKLTQRILMHLVAGKREEGERKRRERTPKAEKEGGKRSRGQFPMSRHFPQHLIFLIDVVQEEKKKTEKERERLKKKEEKDRKEQEEKRLRAKEKLREEKIHEQWV